MSAIRILSGGAAHGLVKSLAARLKERTGLDVEGEFGAVGTMADHLRKGTPADLIILTSALVGMLAKEGLVRPTSIMDVGLVATGLAVRAGDQPVDVGSSEELREALLRADAIYLPDTKASTAGIHIARVLTQLGIAEAVAARLHEHPNGATAMRHLAQSPFRHPIGCTQSTEIIATEGVILSGMLPHGCDLSTMYTAAIATGASSEAGAQALIDLLTNPETASVRAKAGFSDVPAASGRSANP